MRRFDDVGITCRINSKTGSSPPRLSRMRLEPRPKGRVCINNPSESSICDFVEMCWPRPIRSQLTGVLVLTTYTHASPIGRYGDLILDPGSEDRNYGGGFSLPYTEAVPFRLFSIAREALLPHSQSCSEGNSLPKVKYLWMLIAGIFFACILAGVAGWFGTIQRLAKAQRDPGRRSGSRSSFLRKNGGVLELVAQRRISQASSGRLNGVCGTYGAELFLFRLAAG